MSIQEKKVKRNPICHIIKFSDKKGEFELFLFSEILVNNRDKLKRVRVFCFNISKEKNFSENGSKKRINVEKNTKSDEVIKKPYSKVTIELKENYNLMKLKNYCQKKVKLINNLVIIKNKKNKPLSPSKNRKFDLITLKL